MFADTGQWYWDVKGFSISVCLLVTTPSLNKYKVVEWILEWEKKYTPIYLSNRPSSRDRTSDLKIIQLQSRALPTELSKVVYVTTSNGYEAGSESHSWHFGITDWNSPTSPLTTIFNNPPTNFYHECYRAHTERSLCSQRSAVHTRAPTAHQKACRS